MPSPTLCTCTLNIRDALGNNFAGTAELVWEPRKSFIESSSSNFILSRPQRVLAVNGVFTIVLVETASSGQLGTFSINWNDSDKNFGTVVFDPITIPNQASVDLSTLLSVGRG